VDGAKLDNIENSAEKNTASNTGTGTGTYGGKIGSNLAFRSLKDDGNGTVTIAPSGDTLSVEFSVSASSIDTAQLAANSVTNLILDDMPTLTMKGNDTGGTANPKDLTVAEVNAMLGGGGGAPTAAEYVVLDYHGDLSAERKLTQGSGLTITDDGADSTVTIGITDMPTDRIRGRTTGGSGAVENLTPASVLTMIGGAPADAPYLCLETGDAGLSAERYLVLGAGFGSTDNGADSYFAIHVQEYDTLASGSTVTPNPASGSRFELLIEEDVTTFAYPSGTVGTYWKDGQFVEYKITQDGTGGWEVTWAATYETGEIPSVQIAAGADETTYVLMKWNSGHASMDIVSIARGYA